MWNQTDVKHRVMVTTTKNSVQMKWCSVLPCYHSTHMHTHSQINFLRAKLHICALYNKVMLLFVCHLYRKKLKGLEI